MPEARTFTDRWVESLRYGGERQEFRDAACPGLYLRVGARAKTWSALVMRNGVRKRVALGTYPEVSLKEARRLVSTEAGPLAELASATRPAAGAPGGEGGAPTAEVGTAARPKRASAKAAPRAGTVLDMLEAKAAELERRGSADVRTFRNFMFHGPRPALAHFGAATLARDVTPEDVTAWLRGFHEAGSGTRHARAHLSAAFSYAAKADYDPTAPTSEVRFGVTSNPVSLVATSATEARDRVLDADELRAVWTDFRGRNVAASTSILLRLVIAMGGVRITEILRARWDWLEDRGGETWLCLPRTKNGSAHDLPLTTHAARLVDAARFLREDESPFLFPRRGKAAEPVSATALAQCVRRWCADRSFAPFQPRDLRRTMKTHLMERHPELRDYVDVWHNHGRAADVARKHYDRATYATAKRQVAAAIDAILAELEAAPECGR